MKGKLLKWGNSLAVRIPRIVATDAGLKEGDSIELSASRGRLEIRRTSKVPTLAELVERITPENLHQEVTTASSVGREPVEW